MLVVVCELENKLLLLKDNLYPAEKSMRREEGIPRYLILKLSEVINMYFL